MTNGEISSLLAGGVADGRFLDITKIIYVDATGPGGEVLIANTSTPDINLAFLDEPARTFVSDLGPFALIMCSEAWDKLVGDAVAQQDVLKSAKRAFNFFSTVGDHPDPRVVEDPRPHPLSRRRGGAEFSGRTKTFSPPKMTSSDRPRSFLPPKMTSSDRPRSFSPPK